jgi:predicted LPLAT superfamily acyltransferase
MTPDPAVAAAPAWKAQRERGTRFMLNFILWLARHAGRRVTRWTLIPTTAYFLLTAGRARRASRQYLARVHGRPATLREVARHLHTFASVVLDRLMLMLGGFGDIVLDEPRMTDDRRTTYTSRRGSLLFVSHLGSFEALRVVGADRAPMKFLLDREHGRALTSLLGGLKPELAASIIDASQPGPALALTVRQALDDGFRVGMMVDRPRAGEKTVSVPFLGSSAPLPAGPWLLAAALQARVVLAFCLFRGGNRYEGHFELFSEKLVMPRERRAVELDACVRRYAARLEHFTRLAPYNWFNFYDFWDEAALR